MNIFEPMTKLTKDELGDRVSEVVISERLTDSPCGLTTSEYGRSANMECERPQALRDGASYMDSKSTMEVNPKHPFHDKAHALGGVWQTGHGCTPDPVPL